MTTQPRQSVTANRQGRAWWQSFSAKMMLSTSALLLVIIFITSAFSYNALRDMSLKVTNQALEGHAQTFRHDLETRVYALVENLKELSSNAIIANALTDDLGRDVYLRDFVAGLSASEGFAITVAMTNFQGKVIATNRPGENLMLPMSWAAGIVERAKGDGRIILSNGAPYLVIAEPVIFRNTETAEGALIFQVNLREWLEFERIKSIFSIEPWLSSLNLETVSEIASFVTLNAHRKDIPITHAALSFPPSIVGEPLVVHLAAQESFIQDPLDELLGNVAAMSGAIFIIALLGSFWLSKTQTRKLTRLRQEAGELSKAKVQKISFTSDNRDEVDDLAVAFSILVEELQQAYRQLEDESQREIQQRELRFQSIINNSAEGIITLSREGLIETFNPSAEAIFGYAETEVVGKNISMLMPQEERAAHDEYLHHSKLHAPRIINRARDLFGLRKNGARFPLELNVSPMELNGEQKFIGIMRDISERKEFENRINAARVEAEQANLAKSQFLSSMSHELRTPLNAVMGFGQLLELDHDHPLTEAQKKSVSQILKGGKHLLELIDQVLNLAKIESGKMTLSMETVDVTTQLMDAVAMARTMADKRNIHIEYDIPEEGTTFVRADVTRLHQVLLNLLSNATKYNYEGGAISLKCKVKGDVCRFEVKDNGPGIPAHMHDKVFAPFNRLGAEGSTVEGTGIGLTITKELVLLMHGEIGFVSEQGDGAMFWFELPLASEKQMRQSVKLTIESIKTMAHDPALMADRKVLYIEDNPSNLQLMEMILEHHAHLTLLTAQNAELGIAMAKAELPALILMDIQLPGMNGIDAMRALRLNPKTAAIPVIAISANAMTKDIQYARDMGFDGYLTKPLDIPTTLGAIEDALGDESE
ncbi:MAG: PAS domain S-box protein [Rhodospirillales bacterium]|nr:PAS domain S-box protein [Rhodospirillales bacterium]